VQHRLTVLSRDIDNQNGQRVLYHRLSRAVDLIGKRMQQSRPARERHLAAHPEDRGADVVIFEF
jgi:hypothetical protein